MKNFQALTVQDLKTLDELASNGWAPILNKLSDDTWHVGLHHKCAGTPIIILSDDSWRVTNPSPYRIHAVNTSLKAALNDALCQVKNLLEPV